MNYSSLKKLTCILVPLILFSACTSKLSEKVNNIHYPALNPIPVTDIYFGQSVEDKYRFLEKADSTNQKVQQWIKEENKLCDSVLSNIPFRDSLKKELEDAIYSSNIRGGFPRPAGSKLFYVRFNMRNNTQILYYKDSLFANEVELFTTATLNKENKVFDFDYYEPSFDGKYIAFGLSSNGDEMTITRIIDVEKKQLLNESIERTTYGTPYWVVGKNAFFYNQLKEIKTEADLNTMYENSKVKIHWVGTNPKTDKDVFSTDATKNIGIQNIDFSTICTFPNSDKVIAFSVGGSTAVMTLRYAMQNDLIENKANVKWQTICDTAEKVTNFVLNKNQLFVLSFKENSNGCVKKYDLTKSNSTPVTILQSNDEVLEEMVETKDALYIKRLKNGMSYLTRIDFETEKISSITLPCLGYITLKMANDAPSSYLHSNKLYFALESWNLEKGIYYYNPSSDKVYKTDLRPQGKNATINNIVVEEVEVPSHDGQLVPLSIVYLKGTILNGQNPTLVDGYGAYGISMNTSFSLPLTAWLKLGGIYAVAHVRGGGEKGETWHKAGYKTTKPNTWKDFIACSEYLITKGYTSPSKLAAQGASAGGITVGRAITERPDLYKAAIINVGDFNTVRSENSNNTFGVTEFGTTKDSAEFKSLFEMDTYHHIKEDVQYPSLLITAGLSDVRVDWWQPAKAVARFQTVSKNNLVLFKVNTGGHFGDPDKIKEQTDFYSFLFWQLGHPKFQANK